MSKMGESCRGCVFLFTRDNGYSNYSAEDTALHCVHKANVHLHGGEEIPDDFHAVEVTSAYRYKRNDPLLDRWWATCNARCDKHTTEPTDYSLNDDGLMHAIDCDGDEIMKEEAAAEHALKTGDPMPLLIARYFKSE